MPDDISQAEPEEAIAPEAEVQETTPEEETPEEPQTEKPLTTEDYRRIAREEATRVAQSQVARSENRTDRRIQEKFAALNATKGVLKLSDEQVLEAQRQIIDEEQMNAFANPNEAVALERHSEGQAPEADPIRMLNGLIGAVFQTVGTAVTNNDAESKELQDAIDKAWTVDGPEGLAMVQIAAADAARKKAARLEAQKKNAAARVVGGGENNTSGAAPASSASELWGKAYKK